MSARILLPHRLTFNVTVTGGSGSATFTTTGRLDTIYIQPPSGSPTLDYEIQDEFGKPRSARGGISAPALVVVDRLVRDTNTLLITSATADGVYVIWVYWDYGV